jgi:hypothetical protein
MARWAGLEPATDGLEDRPIISYHQLLKKPVDQWLTKTDHTPRQLALQTGLASGTGKSPLLNFCADSGLLRGKESLHKAAFAADGKTLESLIPKAGRNGRIPIKPVGELNEILRRDSAILPPVKEVAKQALGNVRPLNLWHGLS